MKEKQGVLSAGNTDGDPVTRFNEPEIMIRLPKAAKRFFISSLFLD